MPEEGRMVQRSFGGGQEQKRSFTRLSRVFQDGAAALAPAQGLGSGPEGAFVTEPAGLQRELHPPDGHPAGLQ